MPKKAFFSVYPGGSTSWVIEPVIMWHGGPSEGYSSFTSGAEGSGFLSFEFLKRYHETPTIAIVRSMVPPTIPPIIGPRVVLERDWQKIHKVRAIPT